MVEKAKRLKDFQLPEDLIVEILKKLPSKSLMRLRCVSKLWSTIISKHRDFIESIMARSLAKPPQQLPIFIFHHRVHEPFFTVSSTFSQSSKPQVPISRSRSYGSFYEFQYARGLICCSSDNSHELVTIYNPTTRQYIHLPENKSNGVGSKTSYYHFGYDPVMNQYKVLSIIINYEELTQTFHVFTLESPIKTQSWRKIQGNIDEKLFPRGKGVCIDGTIYYLARWTKMHEKGETILLSFDMRSETFDHVRTPETLLQELSSPTDQASHRTLVNYLGKLGCICCNSRHTSMYIMENAEKQEWSKSTFRLPEYPLILMSLFRFSGVTPAGDLFAVQWGSNSNVSHSCVYYYDMKQNNLRSVEIEGTRPEKTKKHRCVRVIAIHDHVENTMWL